MGLPEGGSERSAPTQLQAQSPVPTPDIAAGVQARSAEGVFSGKRKKANAGALGLFSKLLETARGKDPKGGLSPEIGLKGSGKDLKTGQDRGTKALPEGESSAKSAKTPSSEGLFSGLKRGGPSLQGTLAGKSAADATAAETEGLAGSRKSGSKARTRHGREAGENGDAADAASSLLLNQARGKTAQAKTVNPEALSGTELDKGKTLAPKPEPRLTVIDQRRADARAEARRKGSTESAGSEASRIEEPGKAAKIKGGELELDLGRVQGANSDSRGNEPGGETGKAARPGSDFSSMLAERLKEAWNGEIVQSAHIVLKDGDSGTIRLRMRPESLGNVKIELNLADNSISGKIVVESDEAKSAFERNMAELSDAFRQGGFESAKLEVSVGSGDAGNRGSDRGTAEVDGPFWSDRHRRSAVEALDGAVPAIQGRVSGSRGTVDILA